MSGLSSGTGLSQSQGLNDGTNGLWSGETGLVNPDFGPTGGAVLMETTGFVLEELGGYILLE
jgi:hypothetical protein